MNKLENFIYSFQNVLFLSDNSNYRNKLFNKFLNDSNREIFKTNNYENSLENSFVFFKTNNKDLEKSTLNHSIKEDGNKNIIFLEVQDRRFPDGFTIILPKTIKGSNLDFLDNFLKMANIVIWVDTPPYNTKEAIDAIKLLHEKNASFSMSYQVIICRLNVERAFASTDCDVEDGEKENKDFGAENRFKNDKFIKEHINYYTPYYEIDLKKFTKNDFCKFIELYDPFNLSKLLYLNRINAAKINIDNFYNMWENYINDENNFLNDENIIPFFKKYNKIKGVIVDDVNDIQDIVNFEITYKNMSSGNIYNKWNEKFNEKFNKFSIFFVAFLNNNFSAILNDKDLSDFKNKLESYVFDEIEKNNYFFKNKKIVKINSEFDYVNIFKKEMQQYREFINNLIKKLVLEYAKSHLNAIWNLKNKNAYFKNIK